MKIKLFTLLYITLHLGTIHTFGQANEIVTLITAIQANDLTHIETLLAYPSLNLEAMDNDGNTALHHAVITDNSAVIHLLLNRGKLISRNISQSIINLAYALTHNYQKPQGAKINAANNAGNTPLHLAAEKGHWDIAYELINAGAELNLINNAGDAPLHLAVAADQVVTISLLFTQGADTSLLNNKLQRPRELAIKMGHLKALVTLCPSAASLNELYKNGNTLLHLAALYNQTAITAWLIDQGVQLNKINADGNTALHLAAEMGHTVTLHLLLQAGAHTDIQNQPAQDPYLYVATQETPLHLAAKRGHLTCVMFLVEQGANLEKATSIGKTPLHLAVQNGHFSVIKYLIEQGGKLTANDEAFRSSLRRGTSRLNPAELTAFFSLQAVRAALLSLDDITQNHLLQNLQLRASNNPAITPAIEAFSHITNLTPELIQPHTESPEWHLCKLLEEHGVEALRAYIGSKTLIGIVTVDGLFYDKIIDTVNYYQNIHPGLIVFGYVTQAVIQALGFESFDGFIIPGSSDNYPSHLKTFSLGDMPLAQQTETEQLYQKVCTAALTAQIPIFGICAGAQHLVLNRGGALQASSLHYKPITFAPFHLPHLMCLDETQRKKALHHGTEIPIQLFVARMHKYAAVKDHMGNLTLISTDENATPMAYYRNLDLFATQFHPEAHHVCNNKGSISENMKYQTQLLNSFFELCRQHSAFIRWAKERGIPRTVALTRRNQANAPLLQRLQALRENRLAALQAPWTGAVNFLELVPSEEEDLIDNQPPPSVNITLPVNQTKHITPTSTFHHYAPWGGVQAFT